VGAALYIVIDSADPGFNAFVNGKALSRAEGDLAKLANSLKVTRLMDFFSMSKEQFEAEAEQFNTLAGLENRTTPEEQWFTAEDGLHSVRALYDHVEANPDSVPNGEAVRRELLEFIDVLEAAHERGLRWHLGVDY
jgi:hypothetical protein